MDFNTFAAIIIAFLLGIAARSWIRLSAKEKIPDAPWRSKPWKPIAIPPEILDEPENYDQITIEFLMKQHPELTCEEAEDLRRFSADQTIIFQLCYGDGSIMYPLWKDSKERIAV